MEALHQQKPAWECAVVYPFKLTRETGFFFVTCLGVLIPSLPVQGRTSCLVRAECWQGNDPPLSFFPLLSDIPPEVAEQLERKLEVFNSVLEEEVSDCSSWERGLT